MMLFFLSGSETVTKLLLHSFFFRSGGDRVIKLLLHVVFSLDF